ncbi:MAG: DNA polymerase III subunit delta' [Defluviicoccus sp.]|nr:DNA polymerase III subunit delta' [Defluviicoccus sp.]
MTRPPPRENPALIGHGAAEAIFLSAWRGGRIPHAWLIAGPEGIGKATLAYRIARFALSGGEGASLGMAEDHPVFRRVASGGHADLLTLAREAQGQGPSTVIGVDAVRAAGAFAHLTAGEGEWRVLVVDTADDLNVNAANALLKILEEPSDRTLILLVSHSPNRLLPTLRSRCCRLPLRRLPDAAMEEVMRRAGVEADDLAKLMAIAEGSPGRAFALMEAGGVELLESVVGFAAALPDIDLPALHEFADRLARRDAEPAYRTAMRILLWWIARVARAAADGGLAEIVGGEGEAARRIASRAGLDRLAELWEKCARLIDQAESVNLDRKQVVLGAFRQFQSAMRV